MSAVPSAKTCKESTSLQTFKSINYFQQPFKKVIETIPLFNNHMTYSITLTKFMRDDFQVINLSI